MEKAAPWRRSIVNIAVRETVLERVSKFDIFIKLLPTLYFLCSSRLRKITK